MRINFEITDGIYTLSDSLETDDYPDPAPSILSKMASIVGLATKDTISAVDIEKQRRFNAYVDFIKNPPPPPVSE